MADAGSGKTGWRATGHLLGLVAPGVIWIVVFLVAPAAYLMSIAFMTNGSYGLPELPFTWAAFKQLAGYGFLGWSPANLYVVGRTLVQAVLATVGPLNTCGRNGASLANVVSHASTN